MASIGDLRGRVVIDNAGSAVLNKLKSDIDGVAAASKRVSFANLGQIPTNAVASLRHQLDRLNKSTGAQAALAAGAGLGFKGLVDQTRGFNESKFGYGFARLTDHMKDGRLDVVAWRKDIEDTATAVRAKAKDFGVLPEIAMQAREDVEKLGFKGGESAGLWDAALGLHLSEPKKLAAGQAAQFLGAVYRAYENERKELAAKMGKDANDPGFIAAYMKGLAGKAAIAGAESALGPADLIEGMRQYAPQWAGLGISYDMALASLAHGSNYGFRAPELGTAYKSLANKAIKPTAEGMRWYNRLGIDRSKFMEMDTSDPKRGANQLQALLGNALGKKDMKWLEQELIQAQKAGTTANPETRGRIVSELQRRLGPGWEGRRKEIESGYDDGLLAPTRFKAGGFDGLIRAIVASKAGPAALGTMFEGRHIARNDPMFKFYDQLYGLFEKLQAVDGSVMDSVVEARKSSEAGKTDQMLGSWQNLMIALEQSGGLVDKVKDAIIGLNTALAGLPTEALTGISGGAIALGSIGALAIAAKALPMLGRMGRFGLAMTGIPAGIAGLGALGGWALGRAGILSRAGAVGAPIGLGTATAGGAAIMGVQAARQVTLMSGLRAVALGAGRILIPGLGIVSLAAMGAGAIDGYQQTGTIGGAVRGALGMGQAKADEMPRLPPGMSVESEQEAAGRRPTLPAPLSNFDADGRFRAPQADAAGADGVSGPAQSAIEQLMQSVQAVDLTAEGQRIMATLEAGIRAGTAGVVAAMEEAMSSLRAAANRVDLNVGPSMQGSR